MKIERKVILHALLDKLDRKLLGDDMFHTLLVLLKTSDVIDTSLHELLSNITSETQTEEKNNKSQSVICTSYCHTSVDDAIECSQSPKKRSCIDHLCLPYIAESKD